MAEAPRPNTCPKCQTEVHQLVPNEDLRRRVREALPVSYWSPVTADDGQTYYYNLETGEAAWELPRGGQVAKTLFQFLAEKRQWFCQDPSAEGNWEDIPVDAVD